MPDDLGDNELRPTEWDDYIGQESHKTNLNIRMTAALRDVRPLDHILLTGPPGTGKTTLASIIANTLREPFTSLVMPVKPMILASKLRRFQGGILFLDEVHRLPKSQQEDLLTLLEDGYLQTANNRRIKVGWLTVIAATTEPDKVIPALYQRFPVPIVLDPYSPEELQEIVLGMADRLGVDINTELAMQLGYACGGTPRLAGTLVKAARDIHRNNLPVTLDAILGLCRIDPMGLTENHLTYLQVLRDLEGSAGLNLICTMLRLHETVVRDLERMLVDRGLIAYGTSGRELTNEGWNYGQLVAPIPRRAS